MAIVGTLKTFKGGRYFPKLEDTPLLAIDTAPLPQKVRVPLRQGFGDEPEPLVRVGDRVKVGQLLARSDEKICTPVPAPISGEVIALEEGIHPLDGKPTTAVVIESDGEDEWQALDLPEGSYTKWGVEVLGRVLYEAGVTALPKGGFPTAYRSSDVEPGEISHLVINAVETEPYVRGDLALLHEEFDKFVTGIKILKEALGNVEVHIGIGRDQPRAIRELVKRLEYHDWAYVHPLLPKYPQGTDEVLIKTLLNREVPSGKLPTAIGVVVCDVQMTVAAYEAVLEGRPFVERVISLGGSAAKHPRCVRVRLGTPVGDVLEAFGHEAPARVILGGPLRGASISDIEAPLTRDVRAITVLREPSGRRIWPLVTWRGKRATTALGGEPRPCIRCGKCLDACPQNLSPIGLSEAIRQGDLRLAEGRLDIFACIECGLCSYVCPSKISLMEDIRRGKRWILEEKLEA